MPGLIPPEIVEQVRHACDIVDVIGSYVPLKKSGAKFKALSPFQKEKTPSFTSIPPSKSSSASAAVTAAMSSNFSCSWRT